MFISHVFYEQQQLHDSAEGIDVAFNSYFSRIFSSVGLFRLKIAKCVSKIQLRVSEEINANLLKPFIRLEVEAALWQIGLLKFPRPDGFGANFYQKH